MVFRKPYFRKIKLLKKNPEKVENLNPWLQHDSISWNLRIDDKDIH